MLLPHQKGSQEGSQDGTPIQSSVEAWILHALHEENSRGATPARYSERADCRSRKEERMFGSEIR